MPFKMGLNGYIFSHIKSLLFLTSSKEVYILTNRIKRCCPEILNGNYCQFFWYGEVKKQIMGLEMFQVATEKRGNATSEKSIGENEFKIFSLHPKYI